MTVAPGSDSSQFSELNRDSFVSDAGVDVQGVSSFSSTGSCQPPITSFNSKGCDWVTYVSPHFDSRHELVQSMNLESLQDQARLSLHLDVPERVGAEASEQSVNCVSKAPGSAPANMSVEHDSHATGGDPAFGTSAQTIFGSTVPLATARNLHFPRPSRGDSWSRVTVEAACAPRTRINTRCFSIGCPKTYTEYKLRLEVREPEQRSALVAPDPFCEYIISTRYRQVRQIHKQLSRIIPVSPDVNLSTADTFGYLSMTMSTALRSETRLECTQGLPPLPPKRHTEASRMAEQTASKQLSQLSCCLLMQPTLCLFVFFIVVKAMFWIVHRLRSARPHSKRSSRMRSCDAICSLRAIVVLNFYGAF